MPGTAAFLTAWRSKLRSAATLVKVELTDPSAKTLYLSSAELATPDGQVWEMALADAGPIEAPGEFLTSDVSLATCSFTVLGERTLSGQTSPDTILDLLASHYWPGAYVTLWLWERSLANWSDALQVFKGQVQSFEVEGFQARISCRQRTDWNKDLPVEVVTRTAYPRAPEESIDKPIPFVYGALRGVPARRPASEYGSFQHGITNVYGGRRALRGIVTSVGRGNAAEKQRVLFASHACQTFHDWDLGCGPYIEGGDRLSHIDPISGDIINGAAGTGFDIADITSAGVDPFDAFFPVPPLEPKLVASNNGENPRAALEPVADFTYTQLDYDGSLREMTWRLPSMPPAGAIRDIIFVIGFKNSGGTNCRLEMGKDSVGSTVLSLAGSTTPNAGSASLAGTFWPTAPWDFSANYLRAYFNGVATGETFFIYYLGVVVKYRPDWPIVTPGRTERRFEWVTVKTMDYQGGYKDRKVRRWYDVEIPATQKIDSTFYANLEGIEDDGSGTYTGITTGQLIEKPGDTLYHLLAARCGVAGANIDTTAGPSFGSLKNDRETSHDFQTFNKGEMKLAFGLSERMKASSVIEQLGFSVLGWPYLSRFDDKWRLVAWKPGKSVDYSRTLTKWDVLDAAGPSCELVRDMAVNNLTLGYGWDDWSRQPIHSVGMSNTKSSAGHKYRNIRDGYITVVTGTNDKLDFRYGGADYTVTLTAGDYDPWTFAKHVSAQLDTIVVDFTCAYGGRIETGYNDKLDINDGSNKTATIAQGDYTMEDLATAVATALNAVSSGWGCTYSRASRKFTITKSGGTAQLLTGGSGSTARRLQAWVALGFNTAADLTGSLSYAGDFECEEQTFRVGKGVSTVDLEWETGTNGINAATPKTCAVLLGFDPTRDSVGGVHSHTAHSPKLDTEQDAASSVTRFGQQREIQRDLRFVVDTDTAREVRDRIVALSTAPPMRIRFSTESMPDLERGRIFEFDSSMDQVKPYPRPGSDGSWAGKKFVAVEVQQGLAASYHQEVVAYEVP